MSHPFLARERRLIALNAALRPLSEAGLADPAARAGAYQAAGLQPVLEAEDEEALRRARRYWPRVKARIVTPELVTALGAFAAQRRAARSDDHRASDPAFDLAAATRALRAHTIIVDPGLHRSVEGLLRRTRAKLQSERFAAERRAAGGRA